MTKSRSIMAGLVPAIHDCHAREGAITRLLDRPVKPGDDNGK
jgi:hypothetical protein